VSRACPRLPGRLPYNDGCRPEAKEDRTTDQRGMETCSGLQRGRWASGIGSRPRSEAHRFAETCVSFRAHQPLFRPRRLVQQFDAPRNTNAARPSTTSAVGEEPGIFSAFARHGGYGDEAGVEGSGARGAPRISGRRRIGGSSCSLRPQDYGSLLHADHGPHAIWVVRRSTVHEPGFFCFTRRF